MNNGPQSRGDSSTGASVEAAFDLQQWFDGKQWTRYPPTLPQDYYQAIGEICHRWAWLEFQCGVIAREVARLDKRTGYAFMGGMPLKSAARVLIALSLGPYLSKFPDLNARLHALGKKLNGLGDMRNEYAHGVWGFSEESDTRLGLWKFRDPEDRADPNWVHKTAKEMRASADALKSLQGDAQHLTRDLKRALRDK